MTRIFRVNRDQVRNRLSKWAQALASDPGVLCVVLFGSFARGDCTAASDADVLVVLRDSALRFEERIPLYHPTGIGVSVDVFPYTLAEAQQSLKEGWGVAGVALAEGQMLYSAPQNPLLREALSVSPGDTLPKKQDGTKEVEDA